jgi:hypothetical protein
VRASHRSQRATVSRRKKKATLVVVTDPPPPTTTPPPTPPPTTTPPPPPPPVPAPTLGVWRPAGSPPLSDAEAKALVTPAAETRPGNATANAYVPTQAELAAFHSQAASSNPLSAYVTGGFNGTTDEILQWAAIKWGIPVDWLHAQAVKESNWNQQALGDRRDGVDAIQYPLQARIDVDSVYESMGILQIKWRPGNSQGPGTEPLRWKSTAFNADYTASAERYYYDGYCGWCSSGYSAGQDWPSVGAWFSPNPWNNSGAQSYTADVKQILADRRWEQAGF